MIRPTLALPICALAAAPALAAADTADGAALAGAAWEEVVAEARGGEVNFFLWGGSDSINRYVTEYLGARLEEEYGITLNRVGLNDTVEAVNIVLGEKEAGIDAAGSVDLIWINGENFRTMRQGDLAWCGWVETLPNNALIDWSDPSVANDFGVPVDGCEVPWNRAQFAMAYDSATMEEPPRSIGALLDWVEANPGRFTYPAPPDFNGSVFVRHVFYHAAGGAEALLGPFDQATYDAVAAKTWEILEGLEPQLWREGTTYPTSITQLDGLFANGEVAFSFNYDPAQFGIAVESGQWPDSVRSYGFEEGTIGNTNYVLVPYNSPRKAAAMVAANLMISPEAQLEKADPAVWGAAPAIDVPRLSDGMRAAFADLPRHPAVVAPQELAEAALPELQADWIAAIEDGWRANVGR